MIVVVMVPRTAKAAMVEARTTEAAMVEATGVEAAAPSSEPRAMPMKVTMRLW